MSDGPPAELSYKDTMRLLASLGPRADIVLVGGQAVNFWAEHYIRSQNVAKLLEAVPFTSKDVDFCANRLAVEACAQKLGGRALFPNADDFDSLNSGKIIIKDHHGVEREIDFLTTPFGIDPDDIERTSIPVDVLDEEDRPTGAAFRVIQPVIMMESRVHNVVGLRAQYDTPHGVKQLRASILCAREFLKELVNQGYSRAVLKLAKRIFNFCRKDLHGREIFHLKGIDPFDAVQPHPELPEMFRSKNYPDMLRRLDVYRQRIALDRQRRATHQVSLEK